VQGVVETRWLLPWLYPVPTIM